MLRPNQTGIALIQVLLIAAIISVFALSMTQNARKQVAIAQMAKDRNKAEFNLNNAYQLLLLALVSESWEQNSGSPEVEGLLSNIPYNWNFHNKAFNLSDSVVARIQDQSALLSLYLIDKSRMRAFFMANNISSQRADEIIAHIVDWQDADSIQTPLGNERLINIMDDTNSLSLPLGGDGTVRNGYISDISELNHILTLSTDEKRLIENNFTTYFFGDLNPLTASKEMLLTFGDELTTQQLISLRENKALKQAQFKQLTSNSDEDLRYYPANVFKIKLQTSANNVNIEREFVLAISPYASNGARPFTVLSQKY